MPFEDLEEHLEEAFGDVQFVNWAGVPEKKLREKSDWWNGWDNDVARQAQNQQRRLRKKRYHMKQRRERENRYSHCAWCATPIEQPSFIRNGQRVYAGVRKFCCPRCRDRWWQHNEEGP